MPNIIMPETEGHWRVYKLSIETDVRKGAATKYITEYLEAIGFMQQQIHPTMIFERGANLASLYNMNPKAQKTEVSADFASIGGQTIVELTMRVNCLGNKPLSKDYEFWAAELAGIDEVLKHGYVNPYVSDFAADRAKWYNISVMLGILILTIGLMISGFLILMLFLSSGL